MDSHPHLEYAPISDLTNRKYYKFLYMSREFFYLPLLLFKNFKDLILVGKESSLSRPETFSLNSHASAGVLLWATVRYWRICKG